MSSKSRRASWTRWLSLLAAIPLLSACDEPPVSAPAEFERRPEVASPPPVAENPQAVASPRATPSEPSLQLPDAEGLRPDLGVREGLDGQRNPTLPPSLGGLGYEVSYKVPGELARALAGLPRAVATPTSVDTTEGVVTPTLPDGRSSAEPLAEPLPPALAEAQRAALPRELHAHPDLGLRAPQDPVGSFERLDLRTARSRTLLLADGRRRQVAWPSAVFVRAGGFWVSPWPRVAGDGTKLRWEAPTGWQSPLPGDFSEGLALRTAGGAMRTILGSPAMQWRDKGGAQPLPLPRGTTARPPFGVEFGGASEAIRVRVESAQQGLYFGYRLEEPLLERLPTAKGELVLAHTVPLADGERVTVGSSVVTRGWDGCEPVTIRDATGAAALRFDRLFVWDASALEQPWSSFVCGRDAWYEVRVGERQVEMALVIAASYLRDPARRFPVAVDPWVGGNQFPWDLEIYNFGFGDDLFGTVDQDGAKQSGLARYGRFDGVRSYHAWPFDQVPEDIWLFQVLRWVRPYHSFNFSAGAVPSLSKGEIDNQPTLNLVRPSARTATGQTLFDAWADDAYVVWQLDKRPYTIPSASWGTLCTGAACNGFTAAEVEPNESFDTATGAYRVSNTNSGSSVTVQATGTITPGDADKFSFVTSDDPRWRISVSRGTGSGCPNFDMALTLEGNGRIYRMAENNGSSCPSIDTCPPGGSCFLLPAGGWTVGLAGYAPHDIGDYTITVELSKAPVAYSGLLPNTPIGVISNVELNPREQTSNAATHLSEVWDNDRPASPVTFENGWEGSLGQSNWGGSQCTVGYDWDPTRSNPASTSTLCTSFTGRPSVEYTFVGPLADAPTDFRLASRTTSTLRWDWNPVTDATYYHLLDDAGLRVPPLVNLTRFETAGGRTRYFVDETPLAPNTCARRAIRGVNPISEGPASAVARAATLVEVPLPIVTEGGAGAWSVAPGADRFEVALVEAPPGMGDGAACAAATNLTAVRIGYKPCSAASYTTDSGWITSSAFTATGLTGSCWDVRMQARNRDGVESSFGATRIALTVPPEPSVLSGVAVSASTIRWNWTTVAGATAYLLSEDGGAFVDLGAATTVTRGDLAPNACAEAALFAQNDYGDSEIDEEGVATLHRDPAVADFALSPAGPLTLTFDGSRIEGLGEAASCGGVANQTAVLVSARAAGAGSFIAPSSSSGGTTFSFPTLTQSCVDVRVQFRNRRGVLGSVLTFGSLCRPPATPTPVVSSRSTSTVSWGWAAAAGATSYDHRVDGGTSTNQTARTVQTTALTPGSCHLFEVRGRNGALVSPFGSVARATLYADPVGAQIEASSTLPPRFIAPAASTAEMGDATACGALSRMDIGMRVFGTNVAFTAGVAVAGEPRSTEVPAITAPGAYQVAVRYLNHDGAANPGGQILIGPRWFGAPTVTATTVTSSSVVWTWDAQVGAQVYDFADDGVTPVSPGPGPGAARTLTRSGLAPNSCQRGFARGRRVAAPASIGPWSAAPGRVATLLPTPTWPVGGPATSLGNGVVRIAPSAIAGMGDATACTEATNLTAMRVVATPCEVRPGLATSAVDSDWVASATFDLSLGGHHCWDLQVTARNRDGIETAPSAVTRYTFTELPPPTDLAQTAATLSSVSWGWTDNVFVEDGWKLSSLGATDTACASASQATTGTTIACDTAVALSSAEQQDGNFAVTRSAAAFIDPPGSSYYQGASSAAATAYTAVRPPEICGCTGVACTTCADWSSSRDLYLSLVTCDAGNVNCRATVQVAAPPRNTLVGKTGLRLTRSLIGGGPTVTLLDNACLTGPCTSGSATGRGYGAAPASLDARYFPLSRTEGAATDSGLIYGESYRYELTYFNAAGYPSETTSFTFRVGCNLNGDPDGVCGQALPSVRTRPNPFGFGVPVVSGCDYLGYDGSERCDGLDWDCDGAPHTEVGIPLQEACFSPGLSDPTRGVGLCTDGIRTCEPTGTWGSCDGEVNATAERCDSADNDCDGATDEDFDLASACDGPDADACTDGAPRCNADGVGTTCDDRGPTIAYDFRDGAGVTATDASGGGQSLTLLGPTYIRDGLNDRALSFDGLNDRATGATTGLSRNAGTIAFWARPAFEPGDSGSRGFFQTGLSVNATNWISGSKGFGSELLFRFGSATGGCCTNDLRLPAAGLWSADNWTHFAFVWDAASNRLALFVDGVLAGQRTDATFDGPALAATMEWGIGQQAWFDGDLDEVALFDRALSDAEIAADAARRGLDVAGVNAEFCDGADNDCDATIDEGYALGDTCDGADADSCTDGVYVCAGGQTAALCSDGAAAVLDLNDLVSGLAPDDSGDGNNATLGGATSLGSDGGHTALALGKAADGYLQVPASALDPVVFTVAFAARTNPTASAVEALVTRFGRGAAADPDACEAAFGLFTDGTVVLDCETFASPILAAALATHSWTEIAAIYDGSTLSLFVNGVAAEQFAIARSSIAWSADYWFGVDLESEGGGFLAADSLDGWIDSIAVYRRALSALQVATLAASGVPASDRNAELCDGLDNDCDGTSDDPYEPALGEACSAGSGDCAEAGTVVCAADRRSAACNAVAGTPSLELCDGSDNDCDGLTDEDFPTLDSACTRGVGACRANGIRVCAASGLTVTCNASPSAPRAETCDGVDNDCDGATDENNLGAALTSSCYAGTGASLGVGVCSAGTATCAGGQFGECVGDIVPGPERCDGLDNDCDGSVDELFPTVGDVCTVGTGVCANSSTIVCDADGLDVHCEAVESQALTEICNGEDDDCDGLVDEVSRSATLTISGVHAGDPNFDYSRCTVSTGGTECMALLVTVANTGLTVIPAGARIAVDLVEATTTRVGGPMQIGRAIQPGTSEDLVLCWENGISRRNSLLRATLLDENDALQCLQVVANRTDTDFADCGREACDGFDNDADGFADETPETCRNQVGDGTQRCLADTTTSESEDFLCQATAVAPAPRCAVTGCAAGEFCAPNGACLTLCTVDSDCGDGQRCQEGRCAQQSWNQPASNDAAADRASDAPQGCSAAGSPTELWLLLPMLALRRRRVYPARRME